MKCGSQAQRLRQACGRGRSPRAKRERLVAARATPARDSRAPRAPGQEIERQYTLGSEISRRGGVETALVAFVEGDRLLEMRPRGGELAEEDATPTRASDGPPSGQPRRPASLRQRQQLLAPARVPAEARRACRWNVRQPDEHRRRAACAFAELLAQLPALEVDSSPPPVTGEALGGDRGRGPERDQKIELRARRALALRAASAASSRPR